MRRAKKASRPCDGKLTDPQMFLSFVMLCALTCLDASLAECLELETQILYYALRLHHHLGQGRMDVVAARLDQVEGRWTRSDQSQDQVHLGQVRQILDIVVSVGGYVASGEAASDRLAAT